MSPTAATSKRALKDDPILSNPEAIERARTVLADLARPEDVGDYVGVEMIADRLANLRFACLAPGYAGWAWVVTVVRVPRSRTATVNEAELLPGPEALLAPDWIPWAERLEPGDLGPGDVLPHVVDDPRLDPGLTAPVDESDEDRATIVELGLGRRRVLSQVGRDEAAQRWYAGRNGPNAPEAIKAAAPCSTCGFLMPLAGSLRSLFGVCANQWSNSDGRVVAYDHGCGAHSETDSIRTAVEWPANAPLIDDSAVAPFDLGSRKQADAPEVNAPDRVEPAAPETSAGAPGAVSVKAAPQAHDHAETADPGPTADIGATAEIQDQQDDQGNQPQTSTRRKQKRMKARP